MGTQGRGETMVKTKLLHLTAFQKEAIRIVAESKGMNSNELIRHCIAECGVFDPDFVELCRKHNEGKDNDNGIPA